MKSALELFVNYRSQRCYAAETLKNVGEGRESKEYATKEKHRCDKQREIEVKDVNSRDNRGEEQGNGGDHYPR